MFCAEGGYRECPGREFAPELEGAPSQLLVDYSPSRSSRGRTIRGISCSKGVIDCI